jgi:hypothetical protein
LRAHHAILGISYGGSGRAELRRIEEIEKLCSELDVHAIVGPKRCVFERRKIEVVNPVGTKLRIHARFIAKRERIRLGEAGFIKPLVQTRFRRTADRSVAADDVRARPSAEGIREIDGRTELQRKTALQRRDAFHAPSADRAAREAVV